LSAGPRARRSEGTERKCRAKVQRPPAADQSWPGCKNALERARFNRSGDSEY
jgi:hypothetical protein